MRTSIVGIVLLSVLFSFPAPVFGDSSDDGAMLDQARDLVHQAWNPGGDPPSDAQRIDLLTQAKTLAQKSPDKWTRGHRVKAIHDIVAALFELQRGDPDNKAKDYIRDADSELRNALAIAK